MDQALDSLNYRGVFVYLQGDQLEAMRWIRSTEGGRKRDHLFALTGPEREIIRDGAVMMCILPKDRMLRLEQEPKRFILRHLFQRFHELKRFYDFLLQGRDRVAGRSTQVLLIASKDAYRYGYRLWLDHDHGLVLKSQVMDREGHIHEQLMFTAVEFLDHVEESLFRPFLEGMRLTWHEEAEEVVPGSFSSWRVTWLPEGFALVSRKMRRSPFTKRLREQRVYSDGLAAISVFIEPIDKTPKLSSSLSSMGAIHAYRRYLDGDMVTVMGEVPSSTVRRVAESIRRD